jgi:hypothetical protein
MKRISVVKSNIVVSDARFKNEIDLLKLLGFTVIMIKRGEPSWYNTAIQANKGCFEAKHILDQHLGIHKSEYDWIGYRIDHIVHNTGEISTLFNNIDDIVSQL